MLRFSAFLTALALLGACGDDDVDPPPRDASVRRDTGVEPDGGEDPDGGTDPDAGDPGDGGLITPGECSTDEGDLFPLFADARPGTALQPTASQQSLGGRWQAYAVDADVSPGGTSGTGSREQGGGEEGRPMSKNWLLTRDAEKMEKPSKRRASSKI